jgi:hypothetical protein
MKKLASRAIMIAAAGAMLAGVNAYAQTNLIADVPFTFRVAKQQMPAGQYVIEAASITDKRAYRITNTATKETAVTFVLSEYRPILNPGQSRLVFVCGETCNLTEFYTPAGERRELVRQHSKASPDMQAILRVIPATAE